MAVIAGARTFHQVRATVRAGFLRAMQVTWISSPLALVFAQQFLPESMWVSWFNAVAFAAGVYVNTHTKKKRLAALRHMVSRRMYDCD
jgi:Mpv17 / PMP22 family